MKNDTFISHLYKDSDSNWHIQSNHDHCAGVAELAFQFSSEFGMGNWGRMLGELHDRGKERPGFQSHIKSSSGYNPNEKSSDASKHSFVGAKIVNQLKEDCLYWLSNPIAGHHGGLYDIDELQAIIQEPMPTGINPQMPDLKLGIPAIKPNPRDASHICRMLFSCLVDSDWLDTERFMVPDQYRLRNQAESIENLKSRLDAFCSELKKKRNNPLNEIRSQIQEICLEKSALEPGFFDLNVPTGGGKTIASMVWAINHAIKNGKKRIIIAIPFTSIIVQTAETLRSIFGSENVIEHHSSISEDKIDDRNRLASENWDAPIIVTTNVQLLESMFSNKPSKCRKLHSICNSVVVFDEAQTIPLSFLQPVINALKSYTKLFGTSFLFCTATQPTLEGERKGMGIASFQGLEEGLIRHIIDADKQLHDKLRRAEITFTPKPVSIESLCNELSATKRSLCVVNTRSLALKVFKGIDDDGIPKFHLSRMMCPAHLLDTISRIKQMLNDEKTDIRVVSTQLIEAGVDIDFPVVYRQFAGLDSILQAAGRCNREGKLQLGKTFVFQLEGVRSYGSLGFGIDAMKRLLSLQPDCDWQSPETINRYYQMLYANTPSFDCKNIVDMTDNPRNCQYEKASKSFRLIDDEGVNVAVNYGEAELLIDELVTKGPSRNLSRKLGKYCVTIRQHLFNELFNAGIIEQPVNGFYYIPSKNQYDSETGLKTDNEYLEQIMII